MQNQSKREALINQYRGLMKQIKEEPDEAKRNELKKKASDVHDSLVRNEFEDDNVKRFSS